MPSKIRSRPPTARVPWPCILVEGEAKAGKSWAAALLSTSERVGDTYWLDLGEGAADEYGAIPGARYQVLEHDGSYAEVLDQVVAVKDEARRAADAGEPPVVLIIDTISDVWDGLKDWASDRAKGSAANKRALAQDPNAEIRVSQNIWNDSGARWGRLTTALLTFPGIVVLIARGKEVVAMDENGRPVEGKREWRVEVRKNFEFSPTAWIRMQRGQDPLVVGVRSVHMGIKPGEDEAKKITASAARVNLLDWFVFDALKCDPGTAHVRDLKSFHGGDLTEDERADQIASEQVAQRQASEHRQPPRPVATVTPIKPTPEQAAARIAQATTPEDVDVLVKSLEELGMSEVDVEVGGDVMTLSDLARGRREALIEGLKSLRPPVEPTPPIAEQLARSEEAKPAHVPDPTPDPEEQCKSTPARTGVLRSLTDLGITEPELVARFGRPLEQVATRRLTQHVKDTITESRATS